MKNPVYIISISFLLTLSYSGITTLELEKLGPETHNKVVKLLDEAGKKGLPVHMLENKVREGLAKEKSGEEIIKALQQRLKHMSQAASNKTGISKGGFSEELYSLEKENTAKIQKQFKESEGQQGMKQPVVKKIVSQKKRPPFKKSTTHRKPSAVKKGVAKSKQPALKESEPKPLSPAASKDKTEKGVQVQGQAQEEESDTQSKPKQDIKIESKVEKELERAEKALEKKLEKQEKKLEKRQDKLEKKIEKKMDALEKKNSKK